MSRAILSIVRILAVLFFGIGIYAFIDQFATGMKSPHLWSIQTEKSLFGTVSPSAEEYFLFLNKVNDIMPQRARYTLVLPEQFQKRYQDYIYEAMYYLPLRYIHPTQYFKTPVRISLADIDYIVAYNCFPDINGVDIVFKSEAGMLFKVK